MCISRQHTNEINLGNTSECNSHLTDERVLQYIDKKHFISPLRTTFTIRNTTVITLASLIMLCVLSVIESFMRKRVHRNECNEFPCTSS